jgi:hypothetical protein
LPPSAGDQMRVGIDGHFDAGVAELLLDVCRRDRVRQ